MIILLGTSSQGFQYSFEALEDANSENDTNFTNNNILIACQPAADGKISLIPKQKGSAPGHSKSIDEKRKHIVDASKINSENPFKQNQERLQNALEELK